MPNPQKHYRAPEQLGKLVHDERIRAGLVKYKLAARCGMKRRIIGEVERTGPNCLGTLQRIAEGLGKQVVWEVTRDWKRGPWVPGTPGELLKTCRRATGTSQVELAEAAGVSQPMIAGCESGAAVPSLESYVELLTACRYHLSLRFE